MTLVNPPDVVGGEPTVQPTTTNKPASPEPDTSAPPKGQVPEPPSGLPSDTPSDPPSDPPSDAPSDPPRMASLPTSDLPLKPPALSPRSASTSAVVGGMTPSSTPLGAINAARRPVPTFSKQGSAASSDIMARMKAFHLGRQSMGPPSRTPSVGPTASSEASTPAPVPGGAIGGAFAPGSPVALPSPGGLPGGIPAGFKLPNTPPTLKNIHSSPAVPGLRPGIGAKKPSLAEKRGMAMPGGLSGAQANGAPAAGGRKRPGLSLSQITGEKPDSHTETKPTGGTMMDKYSDYLDTKTGSLRFKGKAILNAQGVEFSSGSSFSISLDEVDTMDELGKGNYGTVYKVRHSRPKMRRPGLGLAGNKLPASAQHPPPSPTRRGKSDESAEASPVCTSVSSAGTTGVVMAMKEIRLELDDAKFAAIIMELDILHRCLSPFIVDFYGAFFQEGAVYICMEFMNGGSIDKLYGDGIPENVLRKITLATTMGLKSLKEDHNIIHRDVKPTNILMNTRGQVKICDFGVSGNLVASFAKTNIGCQSYMAPERISTGSMGMTGANPGGGTYSVQSDIWSLGLTIIECALGRYPYPPETYNNIFSQLSAIVDGEPPDLPKEGFSAEARNFVHGCLNKIPKLRPTYAMLLKHAWLKPLVASAEAIIEEDEEEAVEVDVSPDADPAAATNLEARQANTNLPDDVVDVEVAEWVLQALEKRRLGRLGKSEKPALHAAPLDAMVSPAAEKVLANGMEVPIKLPAAEERNIADGTPAGDIAPADAAPSGMVEEAKPQSDGLASVDVANTVGV